MDNARRVGADIPSSVGTFTRTEAAAGAAAPFAHIRSCTSCRQRKVKCDRQLPCHNCSKAASHCVYPPGPGRAAKKPRKSLDSQVLDGRLSKLENILKRLQDVRGDQAAPAPPREATSSRGNRRSVVAVDDYPGDVAARGESRRDPDSSPLHEQIGRLVVDETKSYYVSNILWSSLANEIDELRNLLDEPPSEDEASTSQTESSTSTTASTLGSNAALLGFRSLAHSLHYLHPSLPQSVALFRNFSENIVPLVSMFHMPTTTSMYWDTVGSLDSIDKNAEALLFAIYYSSIVGLSSQQCLSILGLPREAATLNYRFAVEQALARADLLNTQSLILLQAAVLYLSALRDNDESQTSWSLTSLVFHIAQAMGLHRDGKAFGLKPLETEIRRRVWWQICLLDSRSSEYHGYEPIANEARFDTELPLNIHDSDLTTEMTVAPPDRPEFTAMTFCLIRCEATRVLGRLNNVTPREHLPNEPERCLSLDARVSLLEGLERRLQDHYLRYCDLTNPTQLLCTMVSRVMINRGWLTIYLPLVYQKKKIKDVSVDENLRDRLFSYAVELFELTVKMLQNKDFAIWNWHAKMYIQWHAAVFLLYEICLRPPSAQCDRAWQYVNYVHGEWLAKKVAKASNMQRAFKRLMAKARYVRETQKSFYSSEQRSRSCDPDDLLLGASGGANQPFDSMSNDTLWKVDATEDSTMGDTSSALGMEPLGAFLDLWCEDLQEDLFGTFFC